MKQSIILATFIALTLASQLVTAGSITDTYTAGDTLTATKMDNIKNAVNDNDTTKQDRVTGTCVVGQSIRVINADGTVTCEIDSDTDTLSALSCSTNEQIKWNGSSWVCTGQVTKRIFINTYGTRIGGSATFVNGFGTSGSVVFPDAGNPTIDLNFMVPEDNVNGSPLVLEIIWKSTSTVGTVILLNNWGTRQREGALVQDFNGTTGVAKDTSSAAVETIFKSEITLPGSTLSAGDYVSYGIFRRDTSDTSIADVVIGGLSVRYTANE